MLSFPAWLKKFLLLGAEAKTRRFTAHFHMSAERFCEPEVQLKDNKSDGGG